MGLEQLLPDPTCKAFCKVTRAADKRPKTDAAPNLPGMDKPEMRTIFLNQDPHMVDVKVQDALAQGFCIASTLPDRLILTRTP